MLDFGDELIIESYKIPWLIWIHLLVTILFVILIFFGFGVFTSENPSVSVTSASASTSNPSQPNQSRSSHRTKVNESRRTRRDAGTSEGAIIEEVQECEESSLDDSIFFRIFRYPNHPCNYLGLVKQALFKCFGLDSRFEKRRKED